MNLPDPLPTRVVNAHRRHHGPWPVEGCWHCQRGYALCLSKITYAERDAADVHVLEINVRQDWTEPVMRYPCDWGSADQPHWHVAHCKTTTDFKRARRQQRRHANEHADV